MGLSPLTFTGVSKFSDDLQTILKRSVAIASLPVQALQNDQKGLLEKKSALGELRSAVGTLASALEGLGGLSGGSALTATSSSTLVSASVTTGASAGLYQISAITSLAAPAVSTSTLGYDSTTSVPLATAPDHTLELVVGGTAQTITLSAATDNLAGARDAINALDAGVRASIIDTGAPAGRYFLVLSATSPGAKTLALRTTPGDAGTNLLSVTSAGSDASFKINGQQVTSSDNLVSGVIPGVNLQLNGTTSGNETVTVSVAADRAPVVSALQSFVNAYNVLAAKLDTQTGRSGGALNGDSIVAGLAARMRELTSQQGSGAVASLSDLGISMDSTGVMALDSGVVNSMSLSQLDAAFQFLGTATTGFGALADTFLEYSDPLNGLIHTEIEGYDSADTRIQEQIDSITERISSMQSALMARLQAADTLLARLESQQSLLTATIDSLNTVTYGKKQS